jgi:hypothetical protein
MSLRLHCLDVPGDRCRPSTADRTAHVLSAGQKHVTRQASICCNYSYGTCSALDMFRKVIQARWQVNVTAIDRAVSFAQYSNITSMAADLFSAAVCVLHRSLYAERLHVTPCLNRNEHVIRIELCSYSTVWSVEKILRFEVF